jgi:hypothetical protein
MVEKNRKFAALNGADISVLNFKPLIEFLGKSPHVLER